MLGADVEGNCLRSSAVISEGLLAQPSVDYFSYRFLSLANGLRALLVHDPEADKAAASLDVNVGSLSDPDEFKGLAHFTEHMLFYSSEKYPLEDEYSKFISARGGMTNAYTASENTNYSFDINWEHLPPALDRFAQFFICPLISADGVDREVNAVDSEHGKNLQLDAWRALELSKCTANPAHPWARFATGNLETLGSGPKSKGLDVRQAVVDFHHRHYSANLMRLAVVSRHSLDELTAMVETCFAAVPNRDLPVPAFSDDIFLPEQQCLLVKMVPVRELHACEWAWQLPPSTPLYRKAPSNYLSHLLGHEGEGSVFSLLKQRGWATSLVAGESGASLSSASFFYVRVELTEEGQRNVDRVGECVFGYLSLLAREGVRESVFSEVCALARLKFEYRDKAAPYAYATSLSSALHHYPDRDLLLALYNVPQEWDPECVRSVLQCMSLDKVRVTWTSKQHEDSAHMTEPWYGTRYAVNPLPTDWLEQWRRADQCEAVTLGQLHLPAPNPFIPTDLSLRSEDAAPADGAPGPSVLLETPGALRLWHRCDLTFPTPKAVVYVDFQLPEGYSTPQAAVCMRLLVKLVADALVELSYPAALAGAHYDCTNTQSGLQVTVSGYNHKLPELLGAVLDRVVHLEVKADRFAIMAEQVKREYYNMRFSQVYSLAMYRRELLLNLRRWRVEEYEAVLPLITPESLTEFKKTAFRQCFVEMMAVGNVSTAEARGLASQVQDLVQGTLGAQPIFPSQVRDLRTVQLPQGCITLLEEAGPDPANINSAISVVYQVGPDDTNLKRTACLELLVHLGKRDAFNVLRTQQQLGYVVFMFANHELYVRHVEFVIQSSVYDASTLMRRVDGFVRQLCEELLPVRCGVKAAAPRVQAPGDTDTQTEPESSEACADEFHKGVEELCKALLEKPKRLSELAQRWWNECFFGTCCFDRRERVVAALRVLTPADLLAFAAETLEHPCLTRKAVIAIQGNAAGRRAPDPGTAGNPPPSAPPEAMQAVLHVTDVAEFKRGCALWPNAGGLATMLKHQGMASASLIPLPHQAPQHQEAQQGNAKL